MCIRDSARVEVADLQIAEELLARRRVEGVRPCDEQRQLQRGHRFQDISPFVVARAVDDDDRVLAPVRVLVVEDVDE